MAHHHTSPSACQQGCADHHEHGHEHEHGHGHHHDHSHEHHSLRGTLCQIAAGALLLAVAMAVEHYCHCATWQLLLLYLVPYLIVGHGTLAEAVEGLVHGEAFNEHFLMTVATLGALAIGFLPGAETEFAEAVFVMLFFQVGELFEGYAEGKSRDSIAHLMDIRPDVVHVVRDGETHDVAPDTVAVGETVVVKPGERIPLDGVVTEGATQLNTVALTGESAPREAAEGDEVHSGCINISGVIRMKAIKTFGESTASKIIDLVENASEHKSHSEAFITRFARVYTPVVVAAALLLALLPPLCSGAFAEQFPTWLHRALIFLVVSCPCALVISVPLTFFGGIGGASRRGILVKGSHYIDTLSRIGTVVFDKTGTLTHGRFAVEAIHPEHCDERQLLHLAAHVERHSTHPIAAALREAFPEEATDGCRVTEIEEVAGHGIRARVGDQTVCVGNTRMMEAVGAQWGDCPHVGTIVHVAIDGTYAGHIAINDQVKDDSAQAVAALREEGVDHIVMLTGDRRQVAQHVAQQTGIDECHAELLPADKVKRMEQFIASRQQGRGVAFVGDGINDAPALALADVGIAMGGLGSDAAIDAADVVLMDDSPSKVATAIRVARHTLSIARQNVWMAIGIKVAVLVLATAGMATMGMAVFADVGVTVLAVLNAMRTLKATA